MRPGSCLSLLGFHRSNCWMWTTTTVQHCLWALDWQNEQERESECVRGRFRLATVWNWMVLRVQRQQLHSAIILVHGFERFEAFAHNTSPSVFALHISTSRCISCSCTEVVDLLLMRSLLLLYANQQTQYQWESVWLYHMVHSLLITSSDNSSSSLLMTRGTTVIVMFVGKKESKQWCHVSLSIKRLHILSGIINTLGHVASKLALQAKGCHSPDNYFWKWSPNYSDWQMQQSRDSLEHSWRKKWENT